MNEYMDAIKALKQFEKSIFLISEESSLSADVKRDSLLKTFSFTADTFWKSVQQFLLQEGVNLDLYGPNKILLACVDNGIIDDEKFVLFIAMIQDRLFLGMNCYDNEGLAQEIAERTPEYFPLMKQTLDKIRI